MLKNREEDKVVGSGTKSAAKNVIMHFN